MLLGREPVDLQRKSFYDKRAIKSVIAKNINEVKAKREMKNMPTDQTKGLKK